MSKISYIGQKVTGAMSQYALKLLPQIGRVLFVIHGDVVQKPLFQEPCPKNRLDVSGFKKGMRLT